jgi:hypothetical protein
MVGFVTPQQSPSAAADMPRGVLAGSARRSCSDPFAGLGETLSTRTPTGASSGLTSICRNSMVISTAPPEAREIETSAALESRSPKREQRGLPIEISRMMGLQTAYEILGGKKALADALGVGVRSLNHKLNADRGVSNLDLFVTARTLETRAAKMMQHAAKLRAVLADAPLESVQR